MREVTVFVGRSLGAAVVGLGLVSLAGWALEQNRLTSFGLGSASLKVNTAVCFVLLGAAAMLRGASHRQRLRTVLEFDAGAIAVATLVEDCGSSRL